MAGMYRVESFTKPAASWRGVVATAAVLIATTAIGWVLIRGKRSGVPVELTDPVNLASPAVRLTPPRGWADSVETTDGMTVVRYEEPATAGGRVFYVGSWPSSYMSGPQLSLALRGRVVRAGLGLYQPTEAGERAPIGPLPGWQVRGIWIGTDQQGEMLARAAWSPAGRVYMLALRCPGTVRRADRAFVDAVGQTLELTDLRLTDDLGRISESTGLHFELPPDARAVEPSAWSAPSVKVIAGPASGSDWQLTVYRTLPRPGNDLESLVAAYRTERLYDMSPASHLEQKVVGVNRAWRTGICLLEDLDEEFQSRVEVWAVQNRDGPTAMIVAESGGTSQKLLADVCEGIARSLRLTSSPLAPDEAEAERLGADIIAEIGRRGVGHWQGPSASESWFLVSVRGDIGFVWECRGTAEDGAGRVTYEGGGLTLRRYALGGGDASSVDLSRWSIDSDGSGFFFEQWIPPVGDKAEKVRLLDRRQTGSRELAHYINIEEQGYQGRLTTPDDFLPDPLLELAFYLVARRPAGEWALFAGVGSSERMLHRRICRSLGALPNQDDGEGGQVFGVAVRLDYDPTPTSYVFDSRSRVVRVNRGEHHVATRTTRSVVEDRLGPSTVSKALDRWRDARWLSAEQ